MKVVTLHILFFFYVLVRILLKKILLCPKKRQTLAINLGTYMSRFVNKIGFFMGRSVYVLQTDVSVPGLLHCLSVSISITRSGARSREPGSREEFYAANINAAWLASTVKDRWHDLADGSTTATAHARTPPHMPPPALPPPLPRSRSQFIVVVGPTSLRGGTTCRYPHRRASIAMADGLLSRVAALCFSIVFFFLLPVLSLVRAGRSNADWSSLFKSCSGYTPYELTVVALLVAGALCSSLHLAVSCVLFFFLLSFIFFAVLEGFFSRIC